MSQPTTAARDEELRNRPICQERGHPRWFDIAGETYCPICCGLEDSDVDADTNDNWLALVIAEARREGFIE